MVASHRVMTETPERIAREMAEHMQLLAAEGDWEEVERIAARLQGAVMNVPEAERRAVLQFVQQCTESVGSRAESARKEITGRMSALRRGQAATKAYETA